MRGLLVKNPDVNGNFSFGHKLPYYTRSLCPDCNKLLKARVYERQKKVFIKRNCPEHGVFDELYWESASEFERARRYANKSSGVGSFNVNLTKNNGSNCPFDCGLCTNHKNHSAIANIVLTNRCDLSCWYCFFYAKEGDAIYEPSLSQIDLMLSSLKKQKPVAPNAVQFTGGEPTLRQDLIKIIKLAKKKGFEHIQLNTHGINFALNPGLAKKIARAGVTTIYLSFDGVSEKTNPKNHYEVPRILEECRKANLSVVLVPAIIKGVNDSEVGEIISFALRNLDVVRGVNFQPVSFVGRMPKSLRAKERITIPCVSKLIEEQTNKTIHAKDFFSVPCIYSITDFVEALTNSRQYSLNTHFACGVATYLFVDGKKVIPLPRFFGVDSFFSYLKDSAGLIRKANARGIKIPQVFHSIRLLLNVPRFVNKKKAPSGIDLPGLLSDSLLKHDYSALGKFHSSTLFVGMMHFMDLYNYDQQRVERCQVHYAMPDGRIIPFCAFNVLPQIYRDKVQGQFSIPWDEWAKLNSNISPSDKYVRDREKFAKEKVYASVYSKEKNFWR
jgi:uncharacterized radical SAM superfamily Fe-S cluster-containing enzyme